MQEIKYLWYIA